MTFLSTRKPRPWKLPDGGRASFDADGYHLGKGNPPLEVAIARTQSRPNEGDVRNLWKRRKANAPSPLLLVVLYGTGENQRASVCGPTGEDPAVYSDRDPGQIERLALAALDEPDRFAAARLLTAMIPEEGEGIRNVGMFADHHLRTRVPERPDWTTLNDQAQPLLGLRGQELVRSLGFKIEQRGSAHVLRTSNDDQAAALAVFLDEEEAPDSASARFNGVTPATWALARARNENLAYVVTTRRDEVRVYATSDTAGVGRKGGTETYVAANLSLLPDDQAAYLPLLFSADALRPEGTFEQLLDQSHDYSVSLGERLRERVYDETVPALAQAIAKHHVASSDDLDDETLHDLYEQALLALFRLLFIAYAEDRDLLPLHRNGLYRQRSLKHMARELADMMNTHGELNFDPTSTDRWDAVKSLWAAVNDGNTEWGVPKYNGGLFSTDAAVKRAGAALHALTLTNEEFGPALKGLLVEQDDTGIWGPVDFASLKVREFGTVYEGLLESELAIAQDDLKLDADGTYVPAGPKDEAAVEVGDVYLHNVSGKRKSTGSYFTKPFAVSYLLDHALEPALDDHIKRLTKLVKAGDEDLAAEAFFDFRVADLAMGSGHFLVAALDRVEARLSSFIADHPISGVLDELDRLREAAIEALGEQATADSLDTNALLRRQVARRCIYGCDINDIAVELARLALWTHTFVPGLPLTSLNHGLVYGNSLTGVATIEEATQLLSEVTSQKQTRRSKQGPSLFEFGIRQSLDKAEESLARFAKTSEATVAEVKAARSAHNEAQATIRPIQQALDLAIAARAQLVNAPTAVTSIEDLAVHPDAARSEDLLVDIKPLHFPLCFPEVFNGERPGFDCILGNPPWEEFRFDTDKYWARHFPGHGGLPSSDREKARAEYERQRPDLAELALEEQQLTRNMSSLLSSGPDAGSDLAISFSKRAKRCLRTGGFLGYVLPGPSLLGAAKTWVEWRTSAMEDGQLRAIAVLTNRNEWVFEDVDARYVIGLITWMRMSDTEAEVDIAGRFYSKDAFDRRRESEPLRIRQSDMAVLTPGKSFVPAPPTHGGGHLLHKFLKFPRLADTRPDFAFSANHDATAGEVRRLIAASSRSRDLVDVIQGRDLNHFAAPEAQRQVGRSHLDATTAKRVSGPRIAYRKFARPDDSHTIWVAPVPVDHLVQESGYALQLESATSDCSLYMLGMLSSLAFDWQARCWHDFHILPSLFGQLRVSVYEAGNKNARRLVDATRQLLPDGNFGNWRNGKTADKASRGELIGVVDAMAARLYGFGRDDVVTMFNTFHPTQDLSERRSAAVAAWDGAS